MAHEAPFSVGEICVEPSIRTIRNGERSEILQPRVMQVLVRLARARGAVCSRDDLIQSCWGGVVVGDNAIQRAISNLRGHAASIGNESFQIETVKGVGYRLISATAARPVAGNSALLSRRGLAAGLAAVGALASVSILSLSGKSGPSDRAQSLFSNGETWLRLEGGFYTAGQAAAFYSAAVREAPEFAMAWGGLALSYCQMLDYARDSRTDHFARLALSALERCESLDRKSLNGRAARLLIPSSFGIWSRVRSAMERLARAFPDSWLPVAVAGRLAADVGDHRTAANGLGQAVAIDPTLERVHNDLFQSLWASGRLVDAQENLEAAQQRWPQSYLGWRSRFLYFAAIGQLAEAERSLSDPRSLPINLSPTALLKRRLVLRGMDGDQIAREKAIAAYTLEAQEGPQTMHNSASSLALLGARDRLFELFDGYFGGTGDYASQRRRFSRRETRFLFLPPVFAATAGDPRRARLLAAIGLPEK